MPLQIVSLSLRLIALPEIEYFKPSLPNIETWSHITIFSPHPYMVLVVAVSMPDPSAENLWLEYPWQHAFTLTPEIECVW